MAAGVRWDELDLNGEEWHIPAVRMKTGNDHITPIPKQLIPFLEQLKPIAGEPPFVFTGYRDPIKKNIHRVMV